MANIGVIGTGYVGLIAGLIFADRGNKVICLDIDKAKIEELNKGKSPIYEPGIKALIKRNLKKKSIEFTTDKIRAVQGSEIIFITVGTPQDEYGDADLKYFEDAARIVGQNINSYKIIVNKSTVPVGTAQRVEAIIREELKNRGKNIEFDVVSNPEFLAEGTAIKDFEKERIVIGTESNKARKVLQKLYKNSGGKNKKIIFTNQKSAEIIKYASNSMLAMRLSFINEVSQLCEKVGANIDDVSLGVGMDERIGEKFLKSSLGYGGSCFPKDIRAFVRTMQKYGCENGLIDKIELVNKMQMDATFAKVKKLLSEINGKTICVLGISFKANTDDIRSSPAVEIAHKIHNSGGKLRFYDPKAMEHAKSVFPRAVFAKNAYEAAKGSDLLLIATEWEEFKKLDLKKIKSALNQPNVVDGRNLFDPKIMKKMGFNYLSIGR